jgi:D-2-hydroxyglutarate dehydrogenase
LIKAGLCRDAVIAENSTQFKQIWSLRERLAEALTHDGYNYKYDISLPMDRMYNLVLDLRKRLNENRTESFRRCIGYGHMGDGNLHLNLTSHKYDESLFNLIEPFVFEWTRDNSGSVSAEHGLGLKKRDYIYYSKPRELVDFMKRMKVMFDPKSIMNPYKTLPQF